MNVALVLYFLLLVPALIVFARAWQRSRAGRLLQGPDAPPALATPRGLTLFFFVFLAALLVLKSPLVFYVLLGGMAFLITANGHSLEQQFGLGKMRFGPWSLRVFLLSCTALALVFPIGFLVNAVSLYWWNQPLSEQAVVQDFRNTTGWRDIGSFLIYALIITPIMEETLFRGLLYTYLKNFLPPLSALVLSSFLFAWAHADAGAFFPLWILGLILGFAFEVTGVLSVSIGIHACFNSTTALQLLWERYSS